MHKTHFSRYLYSFRIKKGYENISNFLSSFKLPMSDNYYRDVEAGRRSLSIDKAVALYKALPFSDEDDNLEFFWHFFKDTLPDDIHSKLLVPRIDTSFKDVKEARKILEYDLKVQREAAALARFENMHLVSNSIVQKLMSNLTLLPLIHYIYMVDEATDIQIKSICKQNQINLQESEIDKFLTEMGIEISFNKKIKFYKRSKPFFRIPRTEEGIRFKDEFMLFEAKKSLKQKRGGESFIEKCTFDYSGIYAITKEARGKLTDRLRDFISELNVSNKQLDEPSAIPFFISIIVSARNEYDAENLKRQQEE